MDNPHKGHRERLRSRFVKTGGEGLEDHELLELLLFYALPRRDTNAIAHALIKKFASIKGVLSAETEELCAAEGVSMSTAVLIKASAALAKRFYADKSVRPCLAAVGDAAEYIVNVLYGLTAEEFHIFCLDMGLRLIGQTKINRGDAGKVTVNKRAAVQAAINMNAAFVILAHNHPGGTPRPSMSDIELTGELSALLSAVDIKVCDHIITADSGFYSFARHSAFTIEQAKTLLAADKYAKC